MHSSFIRSYVSTKANEARLIPPSGPQTTLPERHASVSMGHLVLGDTRVHENLLPLGPGLSNMAKEWNSGELC